MLFGKELLHTLSFLLCRLKGIILYILTVIQYILQVMFHHARNVAVFILALYWILVAMLGWYTIMPSQLHTIVMAFTLAYFIFGKVGKVNTQVSGGKQKL